MNIILLSGGSGKRLWPLSNEVRSKQFLKIFKQADGSRESMVQRMYRMIREVDKSASVTIATSANQVPSIRTQLGDNVGISIEPCRKDTFPAIALASAYLHDKKGVGENETVIVCPVDPYVDADYFLMLRKLSMQVSKGDANLILMGIEPTYPSEKYGYIIPQSTESVASVETFKEKPDMLTAKKYIDSGALWNAGIFAYKLGYVLSVAEKLLGSSDYDSLLTNYHTFPQISFDFAVTEKEDKIQVMRFSGKWKDLGSWSTLTEAMSDEVSGNAVAVDCVNTHVVNELHLPLLALGVENLAIAATPDGILVADKDNSDQLKDYVADRQPMFEKCEWGEYRVLDYRIHDDGNNFLVQHIVINQNQHILYHIHKHRYEFWILVDGAGSIILNEREKKICRGEAVFIKPGIKHGIRANTELHIIGIQIGNELLEERSESVMWNCNCNN